LPDDSEKPENKPESRQVRRERDRRQAKRNPGAALRPIRALQIATRSDIKPLGSGVFAVESQSAPGASYQVEFLDDGDVMCGCPDYKARRRKRRCKHGQAVVIVLEHNERDWKTVAKGDVLERVPMTDVIEAEVAELTLFQDATRNVVVEPQFAVGEAKFRTRVKRAARIMRDRLPRMLHELLELEITPHVPKPGRDGGRPPKLWLHQRAFCTLLRVFENRPLADVCYALVDWKNRGLLPDSPGVNTLCTYMHDEALEALYQRIINRIARTVRNIEVAVVVDSSSFSTVWSANYLDTDRGNRVYRSRNRWLKAHVGAGPTTSVVSSLFVTWNKHSNPLDKSNPTADVNFFLPILRESNTRGWNISVAAGDKGYFDDAHYRIPAQEMGIRVYIPFKRNTVTKGKSAATLEMFTLYDEYPDEFDEQYNAIRPKIEGVFSATKRTTGDYLWSRGELLPVDPTDEQLMTIGISRRNEMMGKFIIHSLRQLVLLECVHDETVDFRNDRAFTRLPEEGILLEAGREEMAEDENLDLDVDSGETA
jgi:hypothetical protein